MSCTRDCKQQSGGALNKITGNLQISECRQRFKEAIILRFPDRPSYDINFTAVLYEIE